MDWSRSVHKWPVTVSTVLHTILKRMSKQHTSAWVFVAKVSNYFFRKCLFHSWQICTAPNSTAFPPTLSTRLDGMQRLISQIDAPNEFEICAAFDSLSEGMGFLFATYAWWWWWCCCCWLSGNAVVSHPDVRKPNTWPLACRQRWLSHLLRTSQEYYCIEKESDREAENVLTQPLGSVLQKISITHYAETNTATCK